MDPSNLLEFHDGYHRVLGVPTHEYVRLWVVLLDSFGDIADLRSTHNQATLEFFLFQTCENSLHVTLVPNKRANGKVGMGIVSGLVDPVDDMVWIEVGCVD